MLWNNSSFLLSYAAFQCRAYVSVHNHDNYIPYAVAFQLIFGFSSCFFLFSPNRNHAIKWILFSQHWNNSHWQQYSQWKREAPGHRFSRTLVSGVCARVTLSASEKLAFSPTPQQNVILCLGARLTFWLVKDYWTWLLTLHSSFY